MSGNWCTDFKASTAFHPLFNHQQTAEGQDSASCIGQGQDQGQCQFQFYGSACVPRTFAIADLNRGSNNKITMKNNDDDDTVLIITITIINN